MSNLWRGEQPLVLASSSEVRQRILKAAGIPHIVCPPEIDERAVEQRANVQEPAEAAQVLARAKALAVHGKGAFVLGADQTLALGNRRFTKPQNRDAAREELKMLRGQTHELHCAVALTRDGKVIFEQKETARLTMRLFNDEFLEAYLDVAADAVTRSVGAYQVEKTGVHLFEKIEGDYFAILGLPLLSLLRALRAQNLLAA
jgi:nucleoside triphosphate pyrophosphatase